MYNYATLSDRIILEVINEPAVYPSRIFCFYSFALVKVRVDAGRAARSNSISSLPYG